jgi:hypothetical protein
MAFGKRKKIQALEGEKENTDIESGIVFARAASSAPGIGNEYLTYQSQVNETYRKYNNESEWGNTQIRTIVDTRTAFIAGEGVAVQCEDEQLSKFFSDFLDSCKLSGSKFLEAVRGSEMTGRALLLLSPVLGDFPACSRIPYKAGEYELKRKGAWDWRPDSVVIKDSKNGDKAFSRDRFVYIRTGGDDQNWDETTTRVGLCLNDAENYDRALKDIRRTNYTTSRITPTFKVDSAEEATNLRSALAKMGWKIGQAFIGKAGFEYKSAQSGPIANLQAELAASAKSISAVSGIPVHWLGHVDLMSNRATAEELYQVIANATVSERVVFQEEFKDLLVKVQSMYLDSGGTQISSVSHDFEVAIPPIDIGRFESMVKALSQAYADEAISIDDYRAFIPGIDPLKTKRAIEAEKKAKEKSLTENARKLIAMNRAQPQQIQQPGQPGQPQTAPALPGQPVPQKTEKQEAVNA